MPAPFHLKRKHLISIFMIILGSLFLLTIIGLNLLVPTDTYAHPAYGFTPQPPPRPSPEPPPDEDGGGESNDDDNDDDKPDPHYVSIQIESCDLSCSIDAPLAAAQNNDLLPQTAGPANYNPVSAEMLAQVQLVHDGSGWIAEGTISDAKSVRFEVPYPGRWQVFLIAEPEFVTSEALHLAATNIEEVQAGLSQAPLLLGVVEANTAEPQRVKCPLNCPTVNVSTRPPALPETGADRGFTFVYPLAGSALLWLLAFLSYRRYRSGHADC